MQIQSIKFKNFRQYRNAKFEFACGEGGKYITIIQGPNGSGKTNTMNAITWCLYGKELHFGDKYKGLPIINNITLKKMTPNQLADVQVEITMRIGKDRKMIIKRTLECKKLPDKHQFEKIRAANARSGTEGNLEVFIQAGRNWDLADQPYYRVQRLLPLAIQEYFFFDCERLNTYFKNPYPEKIRLEVFKISQLGLFQDVISHIEKRYSNFAHQTRDANPKADDIMKSVEKKKKELEGYDKKLEILKNELVECRTVETDLQDKLRSFPFKGDEVRRLQSGRERMERELNSLDAEVKELKQDQIDYFINISPIILCHDAITNAIKIMSDKTGKGEIPPDIKSSFLKKILEEGVCICNADISRDGTHRQFIEQLLKHCDEIDDLSSEIISENNNLSRMINGLKSFKQKQPKFGRDIKNREERSLELNKELKRISEQLQGMDDEKIKSTERLYQMAKMKKEDIIDRKGQFKSLINSLKTQIEGLTKQFDKEVQKIEKHENLKKILKFCNKAKEAAEEIETEIMEVIRAEIEEQTREHFFELIWKKENYRDVKIDANYNMSVLDQNGMEAIGTLSAGERQVLALSFMAALNTVSGFDAPIIIDTPLGRISREPRLNIASKLSSYLKDKQVCLLVTEEEYTKEVRNKLISKVGKEYLIQFNETRDGNQAEVCQYGE